jgi:hypothetical protein
VFQLVHNLFQSEFTTECDLVLRLSCSSIVSFLQGYPVAVYVFVLVFASLLFIVCILCVCFFTLCPLNYARYTAGCVHHWSTFSCITRAGMSTDRETEIRSLVEDVRNGGYVRLDSHGWTGNLRNLRHLNGSQCVNSVWRRHFMNVGKFVLSSVEASSFLMNWVIVAVQGICRLANWQVLSVWLTDTSSRSNPTAYFKLVAVKLIRGICSDMLAFLQRPVSDYLRILLRFNGM